MSRRRVVSIALVVGLLVIAFAFRRPLAAWFGVHAAPPASHAAADVDHYTCPMHPSVNQHGPGKCPICGMDLVPVTKAQMDEGTVMLDEARQQLLGVRTAPVISAPMQASVRTVANVTYDESALTDVTLRVRGFVTKLYVSRTGQRVVRGQPLFDLYSPELYAAEQDFLLGRGGADGGARVSGLGAATREHLHLLGMNDAQIDALDKRGTPTESVSFSAPASGFVTDKDIVEGAAVEAGRRIFRIAALGKVWIEAEVYEADFALVHSGQPAEITLDYVPGRTFHGTVGYGYPYLDPKTRTGRVRVELPNDDLELRPGMYATVSLSADLGPKLQVPAAAVIYTGPRRIVFVALGRGRFQPREVALGVESNGMFEVQNGLSAGDVVATSGVFLLAAEARITTSAKYWAPDSAAPISAPSAPAPTPRTAPSAVYSCPMHPDVQSEKPGKCPKCGMDLERVR